MAQLRAFADEQQQQEALHGHGGDSNSNKKARAGLCGVLRERKVVELARAKRRLVEVPYTASLANAANALLAGRVSAVTVAAPPGHWIGAGGSLIVESDPATGAARKHYIGMVNMLDILTHIAETGHDDDDAIALEDGGGSPPVDLDSRMSVPVSSVIGHSLEGLTLWTLHPNTSLLDCMETFSKGVHRALVPLESSADNVVAVELVESAPVYRMLTQMDVVRFLRAHGAELGGVLSRTVRELGAASEAVLAVASRTKVIEAIRTMRAASLTAVPVVDAPMDAYILQDVRRRHCFLLHLHVALFVLFVFISLVRLLCLSGRGEGRRWWRRSRRRTCGTARWRSCGRGWGPAWRSSRTRWPSTGAKAAGPSTRRPASNPRTKATLTPPWTPAPATKRSRRGCGRW
ncbi:hypothetical protein VPH35_110016 [Triticum aestivum]